MDIGSGHHHAQWSAVPVDQDAFLAPSLAPVRGIASNSAPPKRAFPIEQSADCHSQSTLSNSRHSSIRTAQIRSSTPPSTQRWKVRWMVLSSPSSLGNFHQFRFPRQCRQEFQAFGLSQITDRGTRTLLRLLPPVPIPSPMPPGIPGVRPLSDNCQIGVCRGHRSARPSEISKVPCSRTWSSARRGVDRGSSAALIVTFVSTTARTLLVTQEVLQNLRRKASTFGRPPGLVHN